MDKQPKFIIQGDRLILGKVVYHKELATDISLVKGGGWFKFLPESNTFVFSGASFDFGQASFEDVKKCVESGNVFEYNRRNLSTKNHFAYDTQSEIIHILTSNSGK